MKEIDQSVRRVLDLAKKTGCFEDPEEKAETSVLDEARIEFITDLAAEGVVLLKNDGQVLPIPRTASVAVIGQHAANPSVGGGGSAKVLAQHIVSPLEGLKASGLQCHHAKGVPVFATVPHAVHESSVSLEWFNGQVVGENKVHEQSLPNAEYMIKEAWPSFLGQDYCTRMAFTLRPKSTGHHVFSVITTGRATVYLDQTEVFHRTQELELLPESFYFYKSKIEKRFSIHMIQGQTYQVEIRSWATDEKVLSKVAGTMFQGSSLRFMEYLNIPNAIEEAASIAATTDVAVVFVGNTNEIESEGYDRDSMDLTSEQYALILAVAGRNPKTVVVNFSGSPVTVSPFIDHVPAFIQGWFTGQECGHSIARVILGDVNPSGRLPMSWPKRNEDNPAYGNFPCDNDDVLVYEERLKVGYRYYDDLDTPEPQFCFGAGLSYTTFALANLRVETAQFGLPHQTRVLVTCDLSNTGGRDGKQVVQIYIRSNAGPPTPVKELKAYSKVWVKAGAQQAVSFELDKYAFSFFDVIANQWKMKKGEYVIQASFLSERPLATATVLVPDSHLWSGV